MAAAARGSLGIAARAGRAAGGGEPQLRPAGDASCESVHCRSPTCLLIPFAPLPPRPTHPPPHSSPCTPSTHTPHTHLPPATTCRSTKRSFNMLDECRSVDCYEKLNRISEGTYGVVYR